MNIPTEGLLVALAMVLRMTLAFAPVPRITWEQKEVGVVHFHQPGVFNYSILLLSEHQNTLYVGAREAIFAVNALHIAEKQHEVYWKPSEEKKTKCVQKGKSKQTECLNYIRVLQPLDANTLYVCGTYAYQPTCTHLSLTPFKVFGKHEDGRGRSPFGPAQSYSSVMVDGELYSGTSLNFLGSESVIFRQSSVSHLRTEYSIAWLNDPSFVYADVIRRNPNDPDGEDDKVYFFFTEVSVEYEFVFKLMIPRVARVCKGDQGGMRILQKRWSTFLKARFICSKPDSNFIFNILQDVFILRGPWLQEPVFYAIFTPQLNNVGLSAVCAYNLSTVEEVFSRGKYMQRTTVESHLKWVHYHGTVPRPRPGACINNEAREANFNSSLYLPDKTLQFVKDHPLMDDSITPIDNRPRMIARNVNYTQIVVDRMRALDDTIYDVMFISTDKGALHKAITLESSVHVIEEIQLFQDLEPVQTLLLYSKKGKRFVYAGSNSGVAQTPVALCWKHSTCVDCVLARDPYCAWSPHIPACIALYQERISVRGLIQDMSGDVSVCPDRVKGSYWQHFFKHGGTVELKCPQKSNLARVVWKFQNGVLKADSPKYILLDRKNLLIFNLSEGDSGVYQCLSEETVKNKTVSQVLAKHILEEKLVSYSPAAPTLPATQTDDSRIASKVLTETTLGASSQTPDMQGTTLSAMMTPPSHLVPTNTPCQRKIVINTIPQIHSEKTMYLKSSDTRLLMFLFLFFFALFLCLFSYNCYKDYLPEYCLKFRSIMLLGKKKPKYDFSDCEQNVKEILVEQGSFSQQNGEQPKPALDTGYETEQDTITSKLPTDREDSQRIDDLPTKDKPFDVKCELKYADSDPDGD